MNYYPTPLESWVSKLYLSLGVNEPADIDVKRLARFFRVFLYYKDVKTMSYEFGRFRSITIDSRLSPPEQHEAFFHELCHLIRHAGWQAGMMPAAFQELQEFDSRNFTRYAAIPYHMLPAFDLRDPDIIVNLADTFRVTRQLAQDRLERISYSSVARIRERRADFDYLD